jgi:hypothetical protein
MIVPPAVPYRGPVGPTKPVDEDPAPVAADDDEQDGFTYIGWEDAGQEPANGV